MKVIGILLGIFVSLPIWLWLLYKILVLVGATELMWFLYWVYLPVTFLVTGLIKCTEKP